MDSVHLGGIGGQEKHALIGDVRGIGPMIAMELVYDRDAKTPAPEHLWYSFTRKDYRVSM